MHRSTANIQTSFSTEGLAAVEAAIVSISERPFEPRCPDPAVCGSEWTAGLDIGSPTVAVVCSRCGRSGHFDAETSDEFRAAAAEATARG